jgi:thiamine-phosphate pyrophosphorylase
VGVDRRARLRDARLYFVADRGGMEHALEGALAGGVDLFQLRDKDATDDELLAAAATARSLCEAAGALFLLNDRPDLAAASGADGVHVGQDDMPVDRARKLVGDDVLVGLSTHSMQQAQAGCRSGANYIAVGPVHATPTKPGRPAAGLAYVEHAARIEPATPWFAIGGIDATTLPAVVAAGARRIVVVRAITEAADPEAAARALRDGLEAGVGAR